MKQTIPILLLLLPLLLGPGGAHAIPLSELFSGGSITAGDKLFDNWQLLFYLSSEGDRSFNAANIEVAPLTGDFGLSFSANNNELQVQGDGSLALVDLVFGFRVSVLDPLWRVTDASLALGGGVSKWNPDGDTDVGMFIDESIGSDLELDDLGRLFVEFSQLNDDSFAELEATTTFAPQSELWVTNNILVWAVDTTDTAALSVFDQQFSQTQAVIPEPSTIVLMLLGVVGLVTVRKKTWI